MILRPKKSFATFLSNFKKAFPTTGSLFAPLWNGTGAPQARLQDKMLLKKEGREGQGQGTSLGGG